MGGIGMLAVGILGFPFIGYLQETTATHHLRAANQALYQTVTVEKDYLLGKYQAIDPAKAAAVQDDAGKSALKDANTAGQFAALGKMAAFPGFMLCCYICLLLYFKSKGGYQAVHIADAAAGVAPAPAGK
jgi:hypothetical protein